MNNIKHIAFHVVDGEATQAFYENVFGYRHVNTVLREGEKGNHVSRHLTDGYMDLTIITYDSADADERDFAGPPPCIHHIGIEVEDLDKFIKDIAANGGEILTAPGHLPVKFRSPAGPVCEVVPKKRWDGETLNAGVHGKVLA